MGKWEKPVIYSCCRLHFSTNMKSTTQRKKINLVDITLSKIRQTQVLYNLTYMESKKVEFVEIESRMLVAWCWEVGEMGRCW